MWHWLAELVDFVRSGSVRLGGDHRKKLLQHNKSTGSRDKQRRCQRTAFLTGAFSDWVRCAQGVRAAAMTLMHSGPDCRKPRR